MTRPVILRDEDTRRRVLEMIGQLNLERPWSVVVEPYVKKRSLSQNALFHKWVGIIAESTGNSLEDVKEAYRDMFLDKVPVRFGDEERMVGRSTKTLNTKEMSEFMDKVSEHASTELGILLPLPEELHQR